MDDQRHEGEHRDGPAHEQGDQERRGAGPERGGPERGGGPDTRFLQLEMSQVLYAEAEDVARPAFRALLLDAAKDHLSQRFGKQITALAQLAVDELSTGMLSSLEIEARIQQHDGERSPAQERLRNIFGRANSRSEPARRPARRSSARIKTKKR